MLTGQAPPAAQCVPLWQSASVAQGAKQKPALPVVAHWPLWQAVGVLQGSPPPPRKFPSDGAHCKAKLTPRHLALGPYTPAFAP